MEEKIKTAEQNDGLRGAIDSIAVIRQVLERGDVNVRSLAPLFIAMGGSTLALTIAHDAASIFLARTGSPESAGTASIVISWLSFAVWAAILVVYLLRRRELRRTETGCTMRLYDLWGGVMFGLPALTFAARLITLLVLSSGLAPSGLSEYGPMLVSALGKFAEVAAVCMALFFTGLTREKKTLPVIGWALLFLCVTAVGLGGLIPALRLEKNVVSVYSLIAVVTSFAQAIVSAVYLVMGIVYAVKRGGESHGNQ